MKLLEQVELAARRLHLSPNTIAAYSAWIEQYLRFAHDRLGSWQHPARLGTSDCEAFLNHLVLTRRLSASSQNQALNALVFLYRHVLENTIPQDHLGKFALVRSRRPQRIPTVLTADEVRRIIQAIDRARMSRLIIELMYGTGMRVSEVCTLRVQIGRAHV